MEAMENTYSLVLFDIDGTLLDMHGAGSKAFVLALEEAFGIKDDIPYISFSGATDLDVLDQIFAHHNRELTDADADRFLEVLPGKLLETVQHAEPTVFPGAIELVEQLSAHPEVAIGIVTGNIESCARIKLKCAGFHGHFELGAFGHEHRDRREIARFAMERAQVHLPKGKYFTRKFLIGDTPSDIMAAHFIGATSIGVATGHHTIEMLTDAEAGHVLTTLEDAADLILK